MRRTTAGEVSGPTTKPIAKRHDGEARGKRCPVQTGLQEDAVGQKEGAVAVEQKGQHEAQRERRIAEQLQVDKRMTAATLGSPLRGDEEREGRHAQRKHHKGPGRPAGLAAVGHRIDHKQQQ